MISPKNQNFGFEVTPVTSSSITTAVASEKVEDTRFVLPDLYNPRKPSLGLI